MPGNDVQLYTIGISYKPHPQVVLKVDYRNFDAGHVAPRADEFNLGAGFVFWIARRILGVVSVLAIGLGV